MGIFLVCSFVLFPANLKRHHLDTGFWLMLVSIPDLTLGFCCMALDEISFRATIRVIERK